MSGADVWVAALTGFGAWWVTGWVCGHAARLRLVQVPNHRSSHAQPTPHGGGLGIVLAGSAALLWAALGEGANANAQSFMAITGLALVMAGVGLLDDLRPVPATLRLFVQVLVCVLLLYILWPLPWADAPGHGMVRALFAGVLLLAGVWWVNLFNFMDGIDGLAGAQALYMLTVALGLAALFHADVLPGDTGFVLMAMATATAGFLAHNWPPARIFMGDVGSTYLAFMIFALGLLTVREGFLSYPCWLVLAAVFVTDATLTLLRRLFSGARVAEAHRSHAYQRLARRLGAHRPVTLAAIAVNVLWLAPLAAATLIWPQWAWAWMALAYAPLAMTALMLGAGRQDDV
jgi:Fuc2NAc and GlcNAc transferase